MLPLALLLALALPLARLAAVRLALPPASFSRTDRLMVATCGLRGAVPLGLALTMAEELPRLQGIPEALAEALAGQLLALVFLVVLINLLLQSGLMHGLAGRRSGSADGASGNDRHHTAQLSSGRQEFSGGRQP